MDGLMDFLIFALPGGFIGSIFTWFVGRRKQNNDMLSQLQASINMLSSENRKILDENIQLRRENADLKANQEEMIQKLSRLTKEVERLRKVINKQTGNDEKPNPRGNPRTTYSRVLPDGMCHGEINQEPAVTHADGTDEKRNHHRSNRRAVRRDGSEDGIPESEAKVDVPIQNLLNLPDGAGYTAKDGQASVSVQRHGDNITVTGKCDSIARQCLFYEREVFRQRNEVDSLKQVISRMEQTSSRSDETYKAESDAAQSIKEKPPATWYKWLLAGFVGGLLLTSPLKKLKNRILTFLK